MVGAHRAVLEDGTQAVAVERPLQQPPRLGLEGQRHLVEGEREAAGGPRALFQGERRLGLLVVEDQRVVPRGGGVDLERRPFRRVGALLPMGIADRGGGAILAVVALADLEREGERPVVHAGALVVAFPAFDCKRHGQAQFHRVAILPFPRDADEVAGLVGGQRRDLAVDRDLRPAAPGRNPQVQREGNRALRGDPEADRVLERVERLRGDPHHRTVGHLGLDLAGAVERGAEAVVGRGLPQALVEIRPAVRVVVLAAAAAERVHHQERPAVLDAGGVVGAVADHHVGRGEVAQRLEVGHHRRRVTIECHLLAMVGPERVAADLEEHLVGEHLLDHAAGLDRLAGVVVAGAAVLVAAEHTAGHLAVALAHLAEVGVGGLEVGGVVGLEEELGRLAEALGDVDVVPVRQVVLHPPVGGAAVDLPCCFEEGGIAGAVEEPVDAEEVVATAHLLPVMGEHPLVGHRGLVGEVLLHQLQHPGVLRLLVEGLQAEQHEHVGPVVAGAVLEPLVGPEVAVGALAGERAFDPGAGFGDHLRVVEEVGQFDVSLEPVGHLFPAVLSFAVLAEPGVVFLLQPFADLAELAGQPVALALEHLPQPAAGFHRADRQGDEPGRLQGRAVADVVAVGLGEVGAGHHLDPGVEEGGGHEDGGAVGEGLQFHG